MFQEAFWGTNGFDELKKYIKHGNEFCKEVSGILQERSELEATYAKGLQKLSTRLTKSASGCLGTLASAWGMVAAEMETEAELHRSLSQALHDDLFKNLRTLYETQTKARKPIEAAVDRAMKFLQDRRMEESKHKKMAYNSAREREKVIEQLENTRSAVKGTKEKDIPKLEKAVRKTEDSMRKADRDYHDCCSKAENARLDWEAALVKGSSQLQTLDEERINQMRDSLNKYNSSLSVINPKLVSSCDRLGEAVLSVNLTADLRTVIDQRGTGPHQPEQLLPDYYAEDLKNTMEVERRRQALQNYILYLQQDVEREHKAKEGVQKLVEVYQNRPSFGDADAQEDARQKLLNANALLNYFEASYYKISSAVATLESRPKPSSKFSEYIEQTKDKQGMTNSILRLPMHMMVQTPALTGADSVSAYRAPADGGHNDAIYHADAVAPTLMTSIELRKKRMSSYDPQDDAAEFEEFPDQDRAIGKCKVLYDYAAQQYDELSIQKGDIINIYEKQADGWWQGELRGKVGIFPATYVEDISA